jgi:peptidoglycan-associated lipoprotein
MRKKLTWSMVLGIFLLMVFFTASCSRKTVQTEPEQTTQPEVKKAPDTSTGETENAKNLEDERGEQARKLEQERLRAEKASREAARQAFLNENIHFEFDSAALTKTAQQILKRKADYLRVNPDVTVMVEGHCDERGTQIYNVALGDRRAISVKEFIVALGIDSQRLGTISYGEERPLSNGHDETSWAMNRRAQFVIN